uniref:Uncharacterized protein n=1 Tax=Anopheles atroparvus TaxID=41427 RepID=A0A182ISP1_ANOAO
MLFEWECAYFMSSAITTPTTVTGTTAVEMVTATTTTTNTTTACADPTEVAVSVLSVPKKEHTLSNGVIKKECAVECDEQHQQEQLQQEQQPAEQKEQPQPTKVQQDESAQNHNTQLLQEEVPSHQQHHTEQHNLLQPPQEQVAPNQQHHKEQIRKKRLKLKPRLKQQSAEEVSTSKPQGETDNQPRSVSAPEVTSTGKPKSKTGSTSGSKKVSPKTRRASLLAIVYKQLMAAGGQGIGVGINKDLPPAARQRPPVQRLPAAAAPADGDVKMSSNKSSSKTLSSESSSDPIPEHFGSAIEESRKMSLSQSVKE